MVISFTNIINASKTTQRRLIQKSLTGKLYIRQSLQKYRHNLYSTSVSKTTSRHRCSSFIPSCIQTQQRKYSASSSTMRTGNFYKTGSYDDWKRTFTTKTTSTSIMSTINDENQTTKQQQPSKKEESITDSMLQRIQECNSIPSSISETLLDFTIDDSIVGKTTDRIAKLLCDVMLSQHNNKPIFEISQEKKVLTLTEEAGATLQSRTEAVMHVMKHLRTQQGLINGWRDELLPVTSGFYNPPLLLIERAAATYLGIKQYGVHVNGYIQTPEIQMWMARRSKMKSKYPSMVDHIVAGGQPANISLWDNVCKECYEEAGIPKDLLLKEGVLKAASAISYEGVEYISAFSSSSSEEERVVGPLINRSVIFCYDLQLPSSFIPKAVDGEVDDFFLWSIDEVKESMKSTFDDPLKPNCYLVKIDFLLRHGYVQPDTPGYLDVVRELRNGFCG